MIFVISIFLSHRTHITTDTTMSLNARELTGPLCFEFTTTSAAVDLSSSFESVVPTTPVCEVTMQMSTLGDVPASLLQSEGGNERRHPSYEQLAMVCHHCTSLRRVHLILSDINDFVLLILSKLVLSRRIIDLLVRMFVNEVFF